MPVPASVFLVEFAEVGVEVSDNHQEVVRRDLADGGSQTLVEVLCLFLRCHFGRTIHSNNSEPRVSIERYKKYSFPVRLHETRCLVRSLCQHESYPSCCCLPAVPPCRFRH